jgi:hypothetical protein
VRWRGPQLGVGDGERRGDEGEKHRDEMKVQMHPNTEGCGSIFRATTHRCVNADSTLRTNSNLKVGRHPHSNIQH